MGAFGEGLPFTLSASATAVGFPPNQGMVKWASGP